MRKLRTFAYNYRYVVIVLIAIIFIGANSGYFYSIYFKGTLAGTNTALKQYPIDLDNKDGTNFFRVDSSGSITGTRYFAGVDSFTTTLTKDTVKISGITTTNVFLITGKTFNYSTAVDSVIYSYALKTDTLIVTRYKPEVSGGAVKSGGQYSYIRIVK